MIGIGSPSQGSWFIAVLLAVLAFVPAAPAASCHPVTVRVHTWDGTTANARTLRNQTVAVSGLSFPFSSLLRTDLRGRAATCLPEGRYAVNLPWNRSRGYQGDVPLSVSGVSTRDVYLVP